MEVVQSGTRTCSGGDFREAGGQQLRVMARVTSNDHNRDLTAWQNTQMREVWGRRLEY